MIAASQHIEISKNNVKDSYRTKSGVEMVGDLADYEYSSDGKRMCFINFITGNVVYSGEALFSKLKNNMLGTQHD